MHGKKMMNLYIKKILIRLLLTPLLFTSLQADIFDFQTIEKANRAYQNGDFKNSAKLFGSLKKEKSIVAYNKANALYKARDYDEALKEYAHAKGVDEAQRLHNVGNCYFQKQDLDRAIEAYEKALKIREDADTRYNLELAKKKKKEKEKKKNNKNKKKNKDKKKQDKKNNQKKKDSDKPKKPKQDNKKKRDEKAEKPMTPEQKKREEMRKKELKHMMNQLSKKKMPTLMYQPNRKKGERDDNQKPW